VDATKPPVSPRETERGNWKYENEVDEFHHLGVIEYERACGLA